MVAVAAFLRVYEPLEALPDVRLSAHVPASDVGELASREYMAALRAASALPPRVVGDLDLRPGDGVTVDPPGLVLSPALDGVVRVCPADLATRALLALAELPGRVPAEVLNAFMPRSVLADVARLVVGVRAGRPPHVRSSGWHIPLPWFALFQPAGRVADRPGDDTADDGTAGYATGEHEAAEYGSASGEPPVADADAGGDEVRSPDAQTGRNGDSLPPGQTRYLATMADARRRLARTLAAVRRTSIGPLPAADLEELGRWLEEFHPRSVVELDYGGLSRLVGILDDSVDRVTAAVNALRARRADDAVRQLAEVYARWAAIRAFEHAS